VVIAVALAAVAAPSRRFNMEILKIRGLCDARECSIFGICCNVITPREVPAVLVKGGLHKLSDLLSDHGLLGKFPEESPRGEGTFIRAVEEVRGIEPIRVSSGLLFASTRPARLEIVFSQVDVEYVPRGGVYARRIRRRQFRQYVNLTPLNRGLVHFLPRLLEAEPLTVEIVPPNEVRVFDVDIDVRLVFGEDGKVKSKSGKIPLTWFSEGGGVLKELPQSMA